MRKLATTFALVLALTAAAPAYSAPRATRDESPITRFVKFVKHLFGMTTLDDPTPNLEDTVIGPIPAP